MAKFNLKPFRLLILLTMGTQIGHAAGLACSDSLLSPPLVHYSRPDNILKDYGLFLRRYAIDQYNTASVFEAQFSIANILRTQPELVGLDLLAVMANFPMVESLIPNETMKIGQAIARERLAQQKFMHPQEVAHRESAVLADYKKLPNTQNQRNAYEAQNDLSRIFLTEPTVLTREMIKLLADVEPIPSLMENPVIQLAHDLARWEIMTGTYIPRWIKSNPSPAQPPL